MKKKILAISMSLALLFSMASCGGNNSSESSSSPEVIQIEEGRTPVTSEEFAAIAPEHSFYPSDVLAGLSDTMTEYIRANNGPQEWVYLYVYDNEQHAKEAAEITVENIRAQNSQKDMIESMETEENYLQFILEGEYRFISVIWVRNTVLTIDVTQYNLETTNSFIEALGYW